MDHDINQPATAVAPASASMTWNIAAPTLGGRQFWGDVFYFRGYRIQKNVFTGHFRLLDPRDNRQAWGTREQCQLALEEIRKKQKLEPMSGRAVILVHGIIRSSHSFDAMNTALKADGYEVVRFDYPSTRVAIEESADYLHQVIESLEGIEQVDFVVHSMGGLVVRRYLSEHRDPRIGRMVMLGVPNHGASLANMLRDVALYKALYGPAGQQLVSGDGAFAARLPTPDFPFGVIAGGKGMPAGFNPLVDGDDDGTVPVESTRLAGAADFLRLPVLHSFLMSDPAAIEATRRFLRGESLAPSGIMSPVPLKAIAPDTSLTDSLNLPLPRGAEIADENSRPTM